nr:T9SS type A sorting domain-containing protein [Saprospiraceae bacterium]
ANTRDISELTIGEYTVSITDNNSGCQFVKSFQLERDGIAAALYYNCLENSMVEVTAVVFDPQGVNYTFNWSNGVQQTTGLQSTVLISATDSISVEITNDIDCEYVSPLLRPFCSDPPPSSFVSATYAYTCAVDNQSATITAYVLDNGNGPYTFSWSAGFVETNVTQSTLTVPVSGSYQVTVADALGNTRVLGGIEPRCGGENGPPLELSIGEANANAGESVCLAVRSKNFINIAGLQYAVAWDAEKLELNSIQNYGLPHLSDLNFNLRGPNYENGLLRMAWTDLMGLGVSMPDDGILYEMCFTVTGTGGEVPVFFDVASMQMEFVNDDLESGIAVLDDGLVIINGEERMWPGDTDHNEVANHFDLLNLGLTYGSTGLIREDANLIWRGQWATDWGQVTPRTGVDYKHIDTNGDGVINTADTTAISLNWGRAVNLSPNPMAEYRSSPEDMDMQGAPIYVEAYPVRPGETVSFDIHLGDNENPVEGAYGLAFTIVYDPLAVMYGSAKATFQDSWLGDLGQDMIALVRDDPNHHRLHIGVTRIDQLEVNGSGAIGQISMTIEDVIFRDTEYEMPFRVENIRLIRASEAEIQVNQKQTIGTVTETPLSVDEMPLQERVKIFPNPTVDLIHIQYRSIKLDRVQLLNLGGQLLREYKAMDQISLQGLAPSTYFLRFIGPDGAFLKKVIKQ